MNTNNNILIASSIVPLKSLRTISTLFFEKPIFTNASRFASKIESRLVLGGAAWTGSGGTISSFLFGTGIVAVVVSDFRDSILGGGGDSVLGSGFGDPVLRDDFGESIIFFTSGLGSSEFTS